MIDLPWYLGELVLKIGKERDKTQRKIQETLDKAAQTSELQILWDLSS